MSIPMLSVRCATCGSPYVATPEAMRLHPNCPFCGARVPQRFVRVADVLVHEMRAA